MKTRRVVTAHTPEGKATVASDTEVEGITFAAEPGLEVHRIWGAESAPTFPGEGSPPPNPSYFPPVNGFRFSLLTIPPESETPAGHLDMEEALEGIKQKLEEIEQKLPGFMAHTELDNPGIHCTDTLDFDYVISGEVSLELDDGKTVHLRAGDTVIQTGTCHAWRNRGSEPCRVVVCLIGAHRR